eukprot:g9288.t1
MPVYGFEFVGDSWKHNCIFLWHCWIVASCCFLIVGLDISYYMTASIDCRDNFFMNRNRTNLLPHLMFNCVATCFFNLFKIVALFLGSYAGASSW